MPGETVGASGYEVEGWLLADSEGSREAPDPIMISYRALLLNRWGVPTPNKAGLCKRSKV